MKQAYFNWSSGKDSALALHKAMLSGEYNIHSMLTVIDGSEDRVSMHNVSSGLVGRQARSIGIPLFLMKMDAGETENQYQAKMEAYIGELKARGIDTALFGDIYLEEIRRMREKKFAGTDIRAEFPLWNMSPEQIMEEFIGEGFKAVVTSIDRSVLDESFWGRVIDKDFVKSMPAGADLCGENGEYHSFVYDGPIFTQPVQFSSKGRHHIDYTDDKTGRKSSYSYLEIH